MRTKAANRLLLGWVILLLLLGAAACYMLYQYLADYEISRPELVMEELMREKSPDDWYGEIRAFAQDGLSEFEDAGAVLDAYYEGSLRGAGFSYRRDTVHSTEENPVFVVRAGSVNFASVTLAPAENGELRFGRHRWEVKSIEPAPLLNNLRGVLALRKGDLVKAAEYFAKDGDNASKAHLGTLDILNGDYASAAKKLAGTGDVNEPLAYILNGDLVKASSLLKDDATELGAYLRAIIAARQGNASTAKSELAKIKESAELIKKAADDVEFAKIK